MKTVDLRPRFAEHDAVSVTAGLGLEKIALYASVPGSWGVLYSEHYPAENKASMTSAGGAYCWIGV